MGAVQGIGATESMNNFIVLATHLKDNDIDVIGLFADLDEATAWTMRAFENPRWDDCLFRVRVMVDKDNNNAPAAADNGSHDRSL